MDQTWELILLFSTPTKLQNPNLRPQRQKKVTELERPGTSDGAKSQLSRREREEIEKQKAKAHYQVSFSLWLLLALKAPGVFFKCKLLLSILWLHAVSSYFQKMHAAGKTEEARADLARLAIIRKQREEAAKKREEEQKGI